MLRVVVICLQAIAFAVDGDDAHLLVLFKDSAYDAACLDAFAGRGWCDAVHWCSIACCTFLQC